MIIEHVKGTEGAQSSPATVIESIYPIIILIKVLMNNGTVLSSSSFAKYKNVITLQNLLFSSNRILLFRLTNLYSWFKPDLHRYSSGHPSS